MKQFPLSLLWIMAMALISTHTLVAQQQDLHVMPLPERITLNPGRLLIDGSFRVQVSGYSDSRLESAVHRLVARLEKKTGIPMPLQSLPASSADPAVLQIRCGGPGEAVQSLMADESYQLEVTERSALLTASSPIGVLRGLETFVQLVDLDAQSFYVPALRVEDKPRFRWRGQHIDVSRHWIPAEIIRRNLDAMSAVKMNVLHWHLSDDQGFRVESKKFPKLHQKGSDGHYYTQNEIRDIVAYAADRGIRVIPEFDMPGHFTSWLVAYPELASAPGPYQIERSWGVFEPCMDPTRESTYAFLDGFIGEMARLFPDEYFHIGGDEVNEKQWNASASIRAFKQRHKLKDNRELQAYFNQRLQTILTKYGKKMMGWDEVLNPGLPKSVVVQVWRRQPSVADVARRGYSGILSSGYYLDHMRPASFHYENDPLGKQADALTPEERSRVLGGEACMWAEFVNPENIESRIWPRAGAIAERLWSASVPTDIPDMYRRLEYLDRELSLMGLRHRSNHLGMLQRLAGTEDPAPLERISEVLVPTGLAVRQKTRSYSSLTPLNRTVDAVLPESDAARSFDAVVQKFLGNPSGSRTEAQQIRAILRSWRENTGPLRALIGHSYLLQEIRPLADTVDELCLRGLQAVDYIESQQRAPEEWRKETSDLLSRSEKPQAEMLPAFGGSIKKLFEKTP